MLAALVFTTLLPFTIQDCTVTRVKCEGLAPCDVPIRLLTVLIGDPKEKTLRV